MPDPTSLRAPRLHESRFKQGDIARNVWRVTPENGTPLEAVLDRNYWINIARQLRVGDLIEVVPEGMPWFAKLYVGYVARPEKQPDGPPIAADVALLEYSKITFSARPLVSEYDIEWRGPNGKYTIISRATKAVKQAHFESKELAAAWLEDDLKKVA